MQQAQALAGVRHKNRRLMRGLRGGLETLGKIHLATKTPGKFRVRFLHRVILLHRSDQHNFHIHLNRLGLQ
jgi:hypothetical protein